MSEKEGKCCLCGSDYKCWGHNPQPVLPSVDQRVCDDCNMDTVIPVRMGMVKLPWLKRLQENLSK